MTELQDRMTYTRRTGQESNLLSYLVRPSCMIIDEVGHCEFDKENTRLFFEMVDRHCQKDGYSNIVFTSNRAPAQWKENFARTTLFCAPWTASLTMLWSLPLGGRASGAGIWRRLPRAILLAHRLNLSRPCKHYCLRVWLPLIGDFRPAEICVFLPAPKATEQPGGDT